DLAAARPLANGHSTAGAASYQQVPAASGNHAPPAIYTAPVVAEYQRPALQLPRTATREARDARDGRDGRDARDGRDGRDARDGRESRDDRARDGRDSRDARDARDGRDGRDDRARDGRESRDDRARDERPSPPAVNGDAPPPARQDMH